MFDETHWSVVFEAARTQSPGSASALAQLLQGYWRPLYVYARQRGCDHHDAQDAIQGFFLSVLENRALGRADPGRGRFRTFLLTALNNYLANEHRRATRQKRGGEFQFVPMDDGDEFEISAATEPPETEFDRQWAKALLERALQSTEKHYAARGKGALFGGLRKFLTGAADKLGYHAASAQLGISEASAKVEVHRLRAQFRENLRQEVAGTVTEPGEIDDELLYLRRLLTAV
ncbi:MAG: sigma-70 family RNA polymerase sigma factor [Chthoniobacterales bacterium]